MKYFLLLLSLLLLSSCGPHDGSSDYKSFNYELRGMWEKVNNDLWTPDGQIMIGYDNITIIGTVYNFGNLPQGVAMEAYADSGFICINARGQWQTPVPYKLWEAAGPYPRAKMLTLKGISIYDDEDFMLIDETYY